MFARRRPSPVPRSARAWLATSATTLRQPSVGRRLLFKLSDLKQKLSSADPILRDLIAQNNSLTAEIDELRSLPPESESAIESLKAEIAMRESSMDSIRLQTEHNYTEINRINSAMLGPQPQRPVSARLLGFRRQLSGLESRLADTRAQIAASMRRSDAVTRRIEALFPFEWLSERDSIRRKMSEMRKTIVGARKEADAIGQQIALLEGRKEACLQIWERWRGAIGGRSVPAQTVDALLRDIENKGRQPKADVKDLQTTLQGLIEGNEALREEVATLTRGSAKKARKMQAAVADMKRQANEAFERAAKEEARMIEKICAAKEPV
jgi:chromosome segregation ATPase